MGFNESIKIFKNTILHPYFAHIWTFYSAIVLGVFVNYLYEILHLNLYWLIVFILLIISIPLILFLHMRKRYFKEIDFGKHLENPLPKKELIILVSREDHAMHSIKYHKDQGKLEHVWLLPSSDAEKERFGGSSRDTANKIIEACNKLGVKAEIAQEVSPADAQDTFDVVRRIYRNASTYGMNPIDIGADFTGGTKPMTLGMIMACLPPERELQYVSYNPKTQQMQGPYFIDYRHELFDLIRN
ncbi:MAG: hypothetical protein OIN66_08655 [Candidatus Methanoperedens sp.]|nr:hypothetical protein [Candidatus Methanoperedens sp.]